MTVSEQFVNIRDSLKCDDTAAALLVLASAIKSKSLFDKESSGPLAAAILQGFSAVLAQETLRVHTTKE